MHRSPVPIATIVIMILIFVMAMFLQIKSYKRGQIDCINGKIKYYLVEQSDKTMKWEYTNDRTTP